MFFPIRFAGIPFGPFQECLSAQRDIPGLGLGKSKWGLSKSWGLKATLCTLRTIVYNCVHFCGLFGSLSKWSFRHKMTTIVGNRGQLWTSTLSPHLLSPHLDFPNWVRDILASGFLLLCHGTLLPKGLSP